MGKTKVEIHQVKEPTGLSTVKPLGRAEEGQVLMISKDLDGKWGTVEVMAPRFESTNNSEEFAIVDIIVSFCGRERLGEIRARMPVSISIGL